MIRILLYIIVYFVMIISSFAQVKSEEILIKNDKVELPGTLTFTKEQTPLLIWVHGSGGVKRDGNQPKYIEQFRKEINQNNLAFFSYDKRTTNPKNIAVLKQGILLQHLISDAQEVVNHLKKDNRFSKIILIGHSQGSLVAMKALKNVDKYISLAGPGETIDKTLIRQLSAQNPLIKKPLEEHFKELKDTGEIKIVNPSLASLFSKVNQPFWLSWIKLDPTEEIKKVTIPTLIINGDKDLQILISDAEALKKGKPNAEYEIIKNMNHVLKEVKDEDNLKSYYSPDYPISKELIKTVVNFVKK